MYKLLTSFPKYTFFVSFFLSNFHVWVSTTILRHKHAVNVLVDNLTVKSCVQHIHFYAILYQAWSFFTLFFHLQKHHNFHFFQNKTYFFISTNQPWYFLFDTATAAYNIDDGIWQWRWQWQWHCWYDLSNVSSVSTRKDPVFLFVVVNNDNDGIVLEGEQTQ